MQFGIDSVHNGLFILKIPQAMYISNLRLWMVMSLNSNTQIINNVWKQIRILEYGTRLYLVVKKHFFAFDFKHIQGIIKPQ